MRYDQKTQSSGNIIGRLVQDEHFLRLHWKSTKDM
jgi:hypothetical protein